MGDNHDNIPSLQAHQPNAPQLRSCTISLQDFALAFTYYSCPHLHTAPCPCPKRPNTSRDKTDLNSHVPLTDTNECPPQSPRHRPRCPQTPSQPPIRSLPVLLSPLSTSHVAFRVSLRPTTVKSYSASYLIPSNALLTAASAPPTASTCAELPSSSPTLARIVTHAHQAASGQIH